MLTSGLHAETVPTWLTKMNTARAVLSALAIRNDESVGDANTTPVGAPPGMMTTSGRGVPSGSYRVEVEEPLFEAQNTPLPLGTSPHGFRRFVSVCSAFPETSETRLT